MFIEILEYLGLAVVIVAFYSSYQRFKNGEFTKEYLEEKEQEEPKTKFQRWWKQSYLREVYVVRAGQRKLISFIPWIGFWISLFIVFAMTVFSYLAVVHPLQPFEKLIRYIGVVVNFIVRKKSADIIQIKVSDGTIKNFHNSINWKYVKEHMNKNISILAQEDWGISDIGKYEEAVLIIENNMSKNDIQNAYIKTTKEMKEFDQKWSGYLIVSSKWLIFFLVLLWFIKRNPIKQKNPKTDKKD